MKVYFKRIILGILIFYSIYVIYYDFTYINHGNNITDQYTYIEVHDGKLHVYENGEGEDTLVFLSGFRTGSPITDFLPLAKELEDDYRVIIIEYFGYGNSSYTNEARTIENICNEIHVVLEALKVNQYILVPHSISGIYSHFYASEFPNEVKAIIGIDSAVPLQLKDIEIPKSTVLDRLIRWSGVLKPIAALVPSMIIPEDMKYYSKSSQKELMDLTIKNYNNKNHLNEMDLYESNGQKALNVDISTDLPFLFILSSKAHDNQEEWIRVHQETIKDQKIGEIKIMVGSHYLYREFPREISDEISEFIKSYLK